MYEKTCAALAKLYARMAGQGTITLKEWNFFEDQLASAYSDDAGIPFIDAWNMREDIASAVHKALNKRAREVMREALFSS